MRPQTGFAKILDTKFYYEISGSGPVVVFLHGNPVDLHMWDYQVDTFAENYRVLRYDMRGFGRSGNPGTDSYSHADDLKAILDYFEIKDAYVVGLSMGGGAAINFAITYPEITRAIVAAGTSLGGYKWSQEFANGFGSLPGIVKENGLDAGREATLNLPIFQHAMKIKAPNKLLVEMLNNYKGWHWLNRDTSRPLNPPAIERIGGIKVPALVIVGEHDEQDFHCIADILAAKIPNARKVVMKGIGHIVNMESPDKFNEIVLGFLNEIGNSPPMLVF